MKSCYRKNRSMLYINKKNSIESIINTFQYFQRHPRVKPLTKELPENIQYLIEDKYISQTYVSTILKINDLNSVIDSLSFDKDLILIIINDPKISDSDKNKLSNFISLLKLSNIEFSCTNKKNSLLTLKKIIIDYLDKK